MLAIRTPLMALLLLAACDGNPLDGDPDPGGPTDSVSTLPGTTNPSATSDITRVEEKDDANGNGYAEGFEYNAADDTFTVDNLAFDGGNVYQRSAAVPNLGPAQVYEADSTYADEQTGENIDQFSYRALYGVSDSGRTNFAIVRTGSYVPYGFGGFIFQRTGDVNIPLTGQAHFAGDYAGLRDFNGEANLQMTSGDMTMDIDFADFNDSTSITGNGIKGVVSNREIFDLNGNNITDAVIAEMNDHYNFDTPITELPAIVFKVGPGHGDTNGELEGTVNSMIGTGGDSQVFEEGKYYAVLTGTGPNGPNEVAGIIVVTSANPNENGEIRETGGFILYRP